MTRSSIVRRCVVRATLRAVIVACTLIALGAATAHPQCDDAWRPTFGGEPGANNSVESFVSFDDGTGAALFAGGRFTTAGGVPVNGIAKWNGTTWSALGSGMGGDALPHVYALALFDDGAGQGTALYAGGTFVTSGGAVTNNIAKWNGSSWEALGSGMNDSVRALATFDDGGGAALYAGGDFTSAGGVAANRVARWNGASWSPLAGGMNDDVHVLTVVDDGEGGGPALYAGGTFSTADGIAAKRIAQWNGRTWSPLGNGVGGVFAPSVDAITYFDDGAGEGPALYVGGSFSTAGGAPAHGVARWNGTAWSALGDGINANGVSALMAFDDGGGGGPVLHAAGSFPVARDGGANHIAKWNGATWLPLGSGTNLSVECLLVFDDASGDGPTLHAGGAFTTAGGAAASRIAKWNGRTWSKLGGGVNDDVFALTAFDDGSGGGPALYVGGDFITTGDVAANRIARWNGTSWSPLGSGMNEAVFALTTFDDAARGGPALYAAGRFTSAGDTEAAYIAKWNGLEWSPLAGQLNGAVRALVTFDDGYGEGPALYAGGEFTQGGDTTLSFIGKWNGWSWESLGIGMDGYVHALAVFDDRSGGGPALYAAGAFSHAGGTSVNGIAKLQGTTWSALGSGMSHHVFALGTFDDGSGAGPALHAGGLFTTAGGVPANHIATWNGTSWAALGDGVDHSVFALTSGNDGAGAEPVLYAGGDFTSAGAVEAKHVAQWNGTTWAPLASGTNGGVRALATFDDGSGIGTALYAGGIFTTSPAHDSFLAKWVTCPMDLAADLNDDGNVDASDLAILLDAWNTSVGDVNGDGTTDSVDLALLLAAWTA